MTRNTARLGRMIHPDETLARQMAVVARKEVLRARSEGVYENNINNFPHQQTERTIAEGQAANRAEAQRKANFRRRVISALTDDWQTARRISERMNANTRSVVEALRWLYKRKQVEKSCGRKPHKYRKPSVEE